MRLTQKTIDTLAEQICGYSGLCLGEGDYLFVANEGNVEVTTSIMLRDSWEFGPYVQEVLVEAYDDDGEKVDVEPSQIREVEQIANELIKEMRYYA